MKYCPTADFFFVFLQSLIYEAVSMNVNIRALALVFLVLYLAGCGPDEARRRTILNVSYDPTRELYRDINTAFVADCEKRGLHGVRVEQSHAGSGKQARAVMDGLDADVVTLALGYDIDILAYYGHLMKTDWAKSFPNNSSPYYSTIVFLVRKCNPKAIHDWGDLVREGVTVVMPNPKTSGGARWNYLAAWYWAKHRHGGEESDETIMDYLVELFRHTPVLSTGARGATNTFIQQEMGDVLVSWENEALMSQNDRPQDGYEIVYPSISVKAEPPVAIVDISVDLHENRSLVESYIKYLYSDEAQRLVAKHFYRPWRSDVADREDMKRFKEIPMITVDDAFGGWMAAHAIHFGKGGTFETVMKRVTASQK